MMPELAKFSEYRNKIAASSFGWKYQFKKYEIIIEKRASEIFICIMFRIKIVYARVNSIQLQSLIWKYYTPLPV